MESWREEFYSSDYGSEYLMHYRTKGSKNGVSHTPGYKAIGDIAQQVRSAGFAAQRKISSPVKELTRRVRDNVRIDRMQRKTGLAVGEGFLGNKTSNRYINYSDGHKELVAKKGHVTEDDLNNYSEQEHRQVGAMLNDTKKRLDAELNPRDENGNRIIRVGNEKEIDRLQTKMADLEALNEKYNQIAKEKSRLQNENYLKSDAYKESVAKGNEKYNIATGLDKIKMTGAYKVGADFVSSLIAAAKKHK